MQCFLDKRKPLFTKFRKGIVYNGEANDGSSVILEVYLDK